MPGTAATPPKPKLADQARTQGWTRDAERQESVARRIRQLLADFNDPPALDDQNLPAGPAAHG
ncbi:MAG: hypothetical protein M3237_21170, partial [Actinomycetota bacterium]|nr:hypothetical protein [Actinomycetota bacterium]